MKTFEIEYELNGVRYMSQVEAWSVEHAGEIFRCDNPGAEIISVSEE